MRSESRTTFAGLPCCDSSEAGAWAVATVPPPAPRRRSERGSNVEPYLRQFPQTARKRGEARLKKGESSSAASPQVPATTCALIWPAIAASRPQREQGRHDAQ